METDMDKRLTELENKFNTMQVPIYAELILGLPGETYESWVKGIDLMLRTGINNQLFVYLAEVYPNTELNDPDYRTQHGIRTTRTRLNEIHCAPRERGWITEFQSVVTETSTMPVEDWKKMAVYALVVMFLHSMKAGIYVIAVLYSYFKVPYLKIFEAFLDANSPVIGEVLDLFESFTNRILSGEGRGFFAPEWSDVFLEPEELAFLNITENNSVFYDELRRALHPLTSHLDQEIIDDLFRFQAALLPEFQTDHIDKPGRTSVSFNSNLPEYAYDLFESRSISLQKSPSNMTVIQSEFESQQQFCQRKVIWARKSGTILLETDIGRRLREVHRVSFDVEGIENEEEFHVNLFDSNRIKFDKFKSLSS